MLTSGRIPYLFDPVGVQATLASFPALAAEPKPEDEGAPAEWFTGIRKSERQLYVGSPVGK